MHSPLLPCLALALACSATAQSTPCHDFGAVDTSMQSLTARISGASLSVARNGDLLFESSYGTFSPQRVVPIASATKWLSGAVILSLWDDGLLDLDAPVSTYLPAFTSPSGAATVRQMFSHTAGMPGDDPVLRSNTLTLAQAVDHIATLPLRAPPGTDFYYGGVSMHVAGRVAEVVAGQTWASLFQQRIAGPLGMASTDYLGLNTAANPMIAGGARSHLRDYARFVEMLQNGGDFRGTRVLSEAAVALMLQDQTGGVPVTSAPAVAPGLGYGIGCWVMRVDGQGRPTEFASPGAFGCTPWIDIERGTEGVLMVRDFNTRVAPFADQVRAECANVIRYLGVDCYGTGAPSCRGPLRARTGSAPVVGPGRFSILCDNAPSLGVGAFTISGAPASTPLPLLNAPLLIDPTDAYSVLVIANLGGRVEWSTSVAAIQPGIPIYGQFLFLSTNPCPGSGPLATSHGLEVTFR